MKHFPKLTGLLIPDVLFFHICSNVFWLLVFWLFAGMPEQYPSWQDYKPVLLITGISTVIYTIAYIIHQALVILNDDSDRDWQEADSDPWGMG